MGKRRPRRKQRQEKGDESVLSPTKRLWKELPGVLLESSLVGSAEEGDGIAEAMMTELCPDDETTDQSSATINDEGSCVEWLTEYFELNEEETKKLSERLFSRNARADDDDDDTAAKNDDTALDENDDTFLADMNESNRNDTDDSDDDGVLIGEGECELCERYIRLTRHHLIPRSTWPRMAPRLQNAADAIAKDDLHRAQLILGDGLEDLVPRLVAPTNLRWVIRNILGTTCDICRPCHSMIHGNYDNMTLALQYNTVDKLLEDEVVRKFCKWANKQRPGKHALPR